MTDNFRADGVRVPITGGTSGLGAAMAVALLDAGAAVAITGRDADRAATVAREPPPGASVWAWTSGTRMTWPARSSHDSWRPGAGGS